MSCDNCKPCYMGRVCNEVTKLYTYKSGGGSNPN
jgi:hypothetical protein